MVSQEHLSYLALFMSAISIIMCSSVLWPRFWPQWKNGLAVARDTVLWLVLVAVVAGFASNLYHHRSDHRGTELSPAISPLQPIYADSLVGESFAANR